MRTLRRVDGVTYWVLEDPKQISRLINSNIRHEWLKDAETDRLDPILDPWLRDLHRINWSLKTIGIGKIKLKPSMVRRKDFIAKLEVRSKQLRRGIELYDQVIWPVIIRGEDSMLQDGYCRYTTLRAMRVRRTLAYVGQSVTGSC